MQDKRSDELPLPRLVLQDPSGGSSSYATASGDGTGGTDGTDGGVLFLTDPGLRDSASVALAFSFRSGGVSPAPMDSLNLGRRVGDDPENVDENTRRLLAAMGLAGSEARVVNPVQVHGTRVLVLDEVPGQARLDDECDAVATLLPGIPVMLCYADCVPVVLVAPGGGYCVVHSGWRGTIGRISLAAVRTLCETSGCDAGSVNAYIGPHIGPCCYEVDDDLLTRFETAFGEECTVREPGGVKGMLDLEYAVTSALLEGGVRRERIASAGICTAHSTDRFFSHRAENGRTGRFAAVCCRIG